MTSKIHLLDAETINKIAAGEVIENPSSVVKELVDNSIDADSTDICIEILAGGRQMIRITDNGCGMSTDDAKLCLQRHATSKIKAVEDIHTIDSMGFRGEAIPSIASISKFTLISCQRNESEGTMVMVDGGKLMQCVPAARSHGTTIEVKSLFFNVPVRKKFQRSPTYDTNEILKMITALALANPEIKFKLINHSNTLLSTSTSQGKTFEEKFGQRIQDVLGNEFFSGLTYTEIQQQEIKISGYVGLPSHHRQNRTGQHLLINRRPVFSAMVSQVIREAYGTALPSNRHPVFVLHIDIPGSLIDVNVHPQKREVRLREQPLIKTLLNDAIQKALQRKSSPAPLNEEKNVPFIPNVKPEFFEEPITEEQQEEFTFSFSSQPLPMKVTPPLSSEPSFVSHRPSLIQILGTIPQYIVVDASTLDDPYTSDGLCLIDQKLAHSRVIFDRLKNTQEKKDIMQLLVPITMDATPIDAAMIRDHIKELNAMGIDIEEFGQNTFIIRGHPSFFGKTDIKTLIFEIVKDLNEYNISEAIKQNREKTLLKAANHAAVSRSEKLSMAEAQNLVKDLFQCEFPLYCPQGKPTLISLSSKEIAKQFEKC